jgi:hypothetical protein
MTGEYAQQLKYPLDFSQPFDYTFTKPTFSVLSPQLNMERLTQVCDQHAPRHSTPRLGLQPERKAGAL